MDLQEFYLNLSLNHECFKLPEKDKKYLLKNNFLNEYFSEEDKAQVRSNLGITSLLDELKSFILTKLFDEEGNITFDLEPHEDAFNKVLSSAVIYNILLKYYTKDEINGWIENLEERLSKLGIVDESLDEKSENPVLNKVITNKLKELNNVYNKLSNNKADKELLLNYNTIEETSELLNQLKDELTLSLNELIAEVNESIENINNFLGKITTPGGINKSVVDYLLELELKIDSFKPLLSLNILDTVNNNLLFYGEN